MKIIKQKVGNGITDCSLKFFKEYFKELGEIKYIVLYYAEREWLLDQTNPDLYHQFVIIIGENAQIWMSGLGWGYEGEGPGGLFEVIQAIDPSITYKQIVSLEWGVDRYPVVFKNIEGLLILVPYNFL